VVSKQIIGVLKQAEAGMKTAEAVEHLSYSHFRYSLRNARMGSMRAARSAGM
jgi:hypothetical protein